jgi:uncharacterized protein involved in outer membrane biogenesis
MRAKRALAVVAGLVLLFAVALVIIFGVVFPPSRIAAEVIRRVEEATGFDLAIESAGLGLGRSGLTVALAKIAVREPTRPEPALLTLERVDLGVAFGPLLRREVRVTRLVLDRPELTLVKDSTGRFNTAPRPRPNVGSTPAPGGAGGRGSAAGGGAALGGGLLLAVPSAEIRHGRIHFVDEATRARYQVEDLDGTIEARLEPDTVRIRTDLVLGGVRADLKATGGATYGPLTIGLRGQVAHAPASGQTVMRDLILALEAIELKVGGTITTPKAAPGTQAGPPLLDLTLESDRFEPSQVLTLFPAAALRDLQLSGHAQLGAQVRGPASAPEIDGELEIDGVSVTPPGRKQPLLTGLEGEARFTRTTLSLSPLTGQFAMSPFKLTATVTNFARPEVKGALDLTAKVTDLAALATLPPGLALEQGKLAFDVNFATKAPKFAEALQMEGTVRGTDIAARLPNWSVPIRELTFTADLTGRGAVIEPFQLAAGRSDVGGRVVWPRFDAPAVEADLRSRLLDLDELAPTAKPASPAAGAPPAATGATGPKSAATGPKPAAGQKSAGSGSSLPSGAPAGAGGQRRSGAARTGSAPPLAPAARGTMQATAVRWQKLTTQDVRCRYALDQRGLTVEDLTGSLLGGTVQGSLAVDLAEPDSVRYRSNLRLTRVQADELVTTFTPAKHILYGELDSSLDLAGILAGESPPLALLNAIGDASVRNGYLAARGSLAVIMRAMGLLSAGSDRLDFQQLTTGLRIESGRVRLSDARLGSTHSGEFTLAGSVGLDGSLDYRVHALLPKRSLPPDLREQKALVELLVDANGRLPLDFIVTGSVSNPKVKVDLSQLQSQAAGRAKQQLEAKGQNEVKKATEKAAENAKQALEGILGNLGRKKPPAVPPDSGRGAGGP